MVRRVAAEKGSAREGSQPMTLHDRRGFFMTLRDWIFYWIGGVSGTLVYCFLSRKDSQPDSHAWCDCCGSIEPVIYDHMPGTDVNGEYTGTDICCRTCKLVIATVYRPVDQWTVIES